MGYTKTKSATQVNTRAIANFLGLAGVITVLPFLIHLQWLIGPIVNAILIITLFVVGIRSALVLCLVPSLMALSGGLLPVILAPIVPFIMISNVIYIILIDRIYYTVKDVKKGYWMGVITASGLKFLFLLASVNIIGGLLIKQELAQKVAQILSWPQFFTALSGGMLAWIVLKILKRV